MKNALLVQLPIPRLNFGRQTGNIPLGAACLKTATRDLADVNVDILPESVSSYLGDAALIELIGQRKPNVVGFTVYCWNVERSRHIAEKLKHLYNPTIIFGGPEITPDNPIRLQGTVDLFVSGEGENIFREILINGGLPDSRLIGGLSSSSFKCAPSPYLDNLLEPAVENLMLLETQRGCPYRCGFCYYNKSRRGVSTVDQAVVLQGISWAIEQKIAEIYLLDPSLNTRLGLEDLLGHIARMNWDKRTALFSEIRAEAVDETLAGLFEKAGFTWFEIGLQSTNPDALAVMNRPTDLARFVRGATLLKQNGIVPGIDLIVGLPGDTLDGFKKTVEFVVENDLFDDVQVFPLSVLPGTAFRLKHRDLKLVFDPAPPYTILETPGFSDKEMLMAFDLSESAFDTILYPMPELDAGFGAVDPFHPEHPSDTRTWIGKEQYVYKILVLQERPVEELIRLSYRVTQPYQIFFGPLAREISFQKKTLDIFSKNNPFTPFEVIFIQPGEKPDTSALLSAVKLKRPHFLDNDLRYLFAEPGNRAVLFTLVSTNENAVFTGDMKRQVFWWRHGDLPLVRDLKRLSVLDGVLIDCAGLSKQKIESWQDRFAKRAEDHLFICFSDPILQKRWLNLTVGDEYFIDVLPE